MGKYDDADWYRSSTWSPEIASAFEARLKRARTFSRAQYVRIQATHLSDQLDESARAVGRDLFRRVIADYSTTDRMEALTAQEQLADALTAAHDDEEAERAYRKTLELIAESPTGRSGTSGATELALAELLLRSSDPSKVNESATLLDAIEPEIEQMSMFSNLVLRYYVARARVSKSLRRDDATRYAELALIIAAETTPSIPRHPDVGRPDATPELVAELKQLTGSSDSIGCPNT